MTPPIEPHYARPLLVFVLCGVLLLAGLVLADEFVRDRLRVPPALDPRATRRPYVLTPRNRRGVMAQPPTLRDFTEDERRRLRLVRDRVSRNEGKEPA